MSKTVFILGAGASISHSERIFPSYDKFFSKAKELHIFTNKNTGRVLKKYKHLAKYILNVMKVDILNEKIETEIDIEKLMTFIDIEIENSDNRETYQIFKKKLLQMIIDLFEALSNKIEIKSGDYNDFVKNIKQNDTIITFNWDLLLDRLLKGKNQYSNLDNLILDEMDLITYNRPIDNKMLINDGYYLKLHGSIDWRYCTNSNCDAYNKILNNEVDICTRCFKKLNRLIIPPIINKHYIIYPFINKLWTLASIQLQHAHKVVIWGYRLPPTDFYSNWLLSKNSNRAEEVSIINPDCILSEDRKDIRLNRKYFLKPFFDIYGEKKINLYRDFQGFLNGDRIK
ncbi:MAG: hypothetical protein JW870_20720 [Candidatus Delongbacteria bacterium]|nr:hypothetical protein [Candidatus Delongbacteria bacterium]